MVPWLQVYANLTTHPKTYALAERLKLTSACVSGPIMAAGMLVGMWLWALMAATDGELTKCSAAALADAAGWKKKPEEFRRALIETGWIDSDGATLRLHDWDEYVGLLIGKEEARKDKTRDRVQRYRDRKKSELVTVDVTPCNADVTVTGNACDTPCNAPTIPNLTVPDQGQGTEGVNARAREAVEFFESVSGNIVPRQLQEEIVARVDGNDAELVREALRLCVGKRQPGAYFAKCLQNWRAEGIADYATYCDRYKTRPSPGAPPQREKSFAEIAAEMEDPA